MVIYQNHGNTRKCLCNKSKLSYFWRIIMFPKISLVEKVQLIWMMPMVTRPIHYSKWSLKNIPYGIIKGLTWMMILWLRVRQFAKAFQEWRSLQGKSWANGLTSDQNIVICGKPYIITRYSLLWADTNPMTTNHCTVAHDGIVPSHERRCCDVTRTRVISIVTSSSLVNCCCTRKLVESRYSVVNINH